MAVTLAEPREHRLPRSIERATGQRVEVAQVPTVADLRARRLELTRASLREVLLGEDLDRYRVVVEALADEFDVMDVALAAVKLAHQACAADAAGDEEEIPTPAPPGGRRRGGTARDGGGPRRQPDRGRGRAAGMARIFVGAGREAGVSPRDLVGAIANEAGLAGADIGAIDIADRFALVDVPEEVADYVIDSMRGTRLKGRRVTVRRDRGRHPGG